jgi:hypothetical protein
MPSVSFRFPSPERIDRQAASLGLSRSAYLAEVVEQALEGTRPRGRRLPPIDDLLGVSGQGSDNAAARRALARRP